MHKCLMENLGSFRSEFDCMRALTYIPVQQKRGFFPIHGQMISYSTTLVTFTDIADFEQKLRNAQT